MASSNHSMTSVLISALLMLIALQSSIVTASSCPQSPSGYYQPPTPGGPFVSGLPPTNWYSYMTKPSTLSCSELAQAHQLCVARINMYRSGQLVFSNGSSDPTLGSPPPLQYASGMDKCHSEITMGDYALMGTCSAGAHENAWSCDGFDWNSGQNLCCPRLLSTTNTFQSLITAMYGCLQSMWDEGMHPTTGVTGHWEIMKDPTFLYASCGFAFGIQNSAPYVLMTQNFGGTYSGVVTPLNSTFAPTTKAPTWAPTSTSMSSTTGSPTVAPTSKAPTLTPTIPPTSAAPTLQPTSKAPTLTPTIPPTSAAPTLQPTSKAPTLTPTIPPTSAAPTLQPTSKAPTLTPTIPPTSAAPTLQPTSKATTLTPTIPPTSAAPTLQPTSKAPTVAPTTIAPTIAPTSKSPTIAPTSNSPTYAPSSAAPTPLPTSPPISNSPTSMAPSPEPTTALPVTDAPTPLAQIPTPAPTTKRTKRGLRGV